MPLWVRVWQNLLDHIQWDHADTISHAKQSDQVSVVSFLRKKYSNLFDWVKWVVEDLLPFNFCEKENPRKFSTLERYRAIPSNLVCRSWLFWLRRISRKNYPINSLLRLMDDRNLRLITWLCSRCSLILTTNLDTKKFVSFCSSYSLWRFVCGFTSRNVVRDFEILWENFSNIACIIGDNCSVNQSLARKCKCYLVGCASHRLNLSIQKYLDNITFITDAVRNIMISLRTIKNRAALKKFLPCLQFWITLRDGLPILRCCNDTRSFKTILPISFR